MTTHHEAGGRRVVGHHAFQVELEVAVAAVDHFDAGHHEVGGGQHRADVATGAAQLGLGDKSNFGLHLGVNEFTDLALAAIGYGVVVGHEAKHGRGDPHLLHLGVRSQPGLQADDACAPRHLAAADVVLDGVGIVPVHLGVVVGDFGGVLLLQLAVFQALGQGSDGGGVEFHAATLLACWPACWRSRAMVMAVSSIMSS